MQWRSLEPCCGDPCRSITSGGRRPSGMTRHCCPWKFHIFRLSEEDGGIPLAVAAWSVLRWAVRVALGIVGVIFLVFLSRGSASASPLPAPASSGPTLLPFPAATSAVPSTTASTAAAGTLVQPSNVSSTVATVVSAAPSIESRTAQTVPKTAAVPAPSKTADSIPVDTAAAPVVSLLRVGNPAGRLVRTVTTSVGSGAIEAARTMGAHCSRNGSWR